MHGRQRQAAHPETPEEAAAAAALVTKLGKFRKLIAACISRRSVGAGNPVVLQLNTKAVAVNPDIHTLWNQRRELLLAAEPPTLGQQPAFVAGELQLTASCLKERNPKSYFAWFQRRWALALAFRCVGAEQADGLVETELALCARFLHADERNFHCWNHRRWLLSLGERSASVDQEALSKLIDRNFSNFSAWHQRCRAVSSGLGAAGGVPELLGVVEAELEQVRSALFAEPDDQTGWVYHRWLLGRLLCVVRQEPVALPVDLSTSVTTPLEAFRAPHPSSKASAAAGTEFGVWAMDTASDRAVEGATAADAARARACLEAEREQCWQLVSLEVGLDQEAAAQGEAPAKLSAGRGIWPMLAVASLNCALSAGAAPAQRALLKALAVADGRHRQLYRHALAGHDRVLLPA